MNGKILEFLEVAVKTKYAGPNAFNPESLLLNVIMIQVCASLISYRQTWSTTQRCKCCSWPQHVM